ncbi:acyl-CoA dehydrogenase family protein [Chroococcidiopsis sp. CCMEE 29]|uniref:acyl-CoA dehydrogenase family protein n=1 Tax=Chroococcidiopsis sp. CCMEE 29 TaxID=155894 RepID=UPI00201FC381|nr:acyl-CoA dehydrogenase family protein [Chroococcidiopsis sp. CCMEE 29]
MDGYQHLLNLAKSYLQESVFPHAAVINSDPMALQKALMGLGELGLLALRIPSEGGGLAVSQETFHTFQELVARYSGALAFLQTQHQSAAAMLIQSKNSFLQQEYLPALSNGKVLLGVGFSHLRREGDPLVKAVPVTGGYQIEGHVPWVTGFGLFQEFIVAATLPDGQVVFGVVPFVKTIQDGWGTIAFSQAIALAAMTSTNTVTATLKSWFLSEEHVVSVKPRDWIDKNDKKNVLNPTSLALGCATAGLDILQAAHSTKPLAFIVQAFKTLNQEIADCRTAIRQAQQNQGESLDKRLQLRAWAIDLAVRCSHAAIAVSSGAANYSHHAAQRVYREALVFTVSGQTTAVMAATLARLQRSEFEQAVVRR